MEQKKNIKKSWRKIAKEKISQEMFFGWNYERDQLYRENRKKDLRWYERMVNDWTMSDVERVGELLRHRKEYDQEVFSHQFYQVIYPLLKDSGKHPDVDKICGLLSQVVEKRLCEESPKYGMWQ
ncbi:hypothetical protein IJJ97_05650 [bacterium]|nr:hypothetical protein [bacterium]